MNLVVSGRSMRSTHANFCLSMSSKSFEVTTALDKGGLGGSMITLHMRSNHLLYTSQSVEAPGIVEPGTVDSADDGEEYDAKYVEYN